MRVGLVIMVHGEGLEPSQAYAHMALNHACLPFHHPCIKLNLMTFEVFGQSKMDLVPDLN